MKEINKSIGRYRSVGIQIEVNEEEKTVKITQKELINGYILTNKELYQRARDLFGKEYKILPIVFSLDLNEITKEWISEQMQDLGIKPKDIISQLGVDKSSLSLYLNGKNKMNKLVRASFYYYFLVYRLNRDLRQQLNN
jgi:hypothetical protein